MYVYTYIQHCQSCMRCTHTPRTIDFAPFERAGLIRSDAIDVYIFYGLVRFLTALPARNNKTLIKWHEKRRTYEAAKILPVYAHRYGVYFLSFFTMINEFERAEKVRKTMTYDVSIAYPSENIYINTDIGTRDLKIVRSFVLMLEYRLIEGFFFIRLWECALIKNTL